MPTITSQATGNWTAGGTWVGGVAPGDGDLSVIANGHTVTIQAADSITIGTGTASDLAIRTSGTGGTGILVCEDGFALTLKSSVQQGNATWTIGRGTLTYTNASDGTWAIGDDHGLANSILNILGASGTYGTLSSSSTGVLTFTGNGFLQAGRGSIRYYNLTKIGKSTVDLWNFNVTGSGNSFSIRDCTMDNCGQINNTFAPHTASTIIIDDTKWSNTPGACIGPNLSGSNALSGGARSMQGNYFDKPIGTAASGGQWLDFTIRYNFVTVMYTIDSSDVPFPAVFQSNLLISNTVDPLVIGVDTAAAAPNFLHIHNTSSVLNNAHAVSLSVRRNVTFDGWFIEPGDTDNDGDWILANEPASARSHVVSHNIARLNKNGGHGGMLTSAGGNANYNIAVRNNTYFATADSAEPGGCSYGESYEGHTGIFDEIVNNLVVGDGEGYVFIRRDKRSLSDGCASANVHHNGKYQLSAGSLGVNGYDDKATVGTFAAMFSSGSPGANDVTANPQFVDDTRSIATWAVDRGYTVEAAYNDRVLDAYDAIKLAPRTRIPDLIEWCRAGFVPTNEDFRAAGDGGVDIGAIEMEDLPAATPVFLGPVRSNLVWR